MKYSTSNPPTKCMMTNSTCYKGTSKMNVLGVLWHSTGANNPYLKRYVQPSSNDANYTALMNMLGKNTYANDWNHTSVEAGLNAWIGKLDNGSVTTMQTMPWDYRPWGCGSGPKGSCNSGWIQFEICEDGLTDATYFNQVYKEACELTAFLCKLYNINPKGTVSYAGTTVPTILCHYDSHNLGLGSNHGDVYHWFNKYGKTMDSVRNDVAALLGSAPSQNAQSTNSNFPATPFLVQVIIPDLNYRSEGSMDGKVLGQTGKGSFTITKVSNGWGYLKSGAGWIYLENPEYVTIKGTTTSTPAATPAPTPTVSGTPSTGSAADEKKIWDYLYSKIGNAYGVAGVMGNMYAESGLKSNNLQQSYETKLGFTDASYTAAVDNGTYTNFIKDSTGYGLVQWTYWSLKQDFYNYVKSKGKSIGDLDIQLEFLCKQLSEGYKTSVWDVLKSATSVLQASNAMLLKFERPADQSEAVQTKRANYGQTYYNKYATTNSNSTITTGGTTMSVTICHASIAETGGTGWDGRAQAGDQTGSEVCTRTWYNKPWDIMLRYPDANIVQQAAAAAKKLANSNLVGYDQSQRNTLYQQLKKHNFNVDAYIASGVKTETDCSAFVYACYACFIPGMRSDSNAPTTSSMRSFYKNHGFTLYTESKYISQDSYLKVGDVLVKESAHTVMAISNGSNAGATVTPAQPANPSGNTTYCGKGIGVATSKEVMNIRSGSSTNYSSYGTIPVGTKVEVLEVLSNGWYKIVWPGASCGYAYTSNSNGAYYSYVANKPVATPAPAPSTTAKKTATEGAASKDANLAGTYVTTANLNVRNGAGTSKSILTTIPKGTEVKNYGYYTAVSGTKWLYIQFTYKNVVYTGFSSGTYLKKK